MIEILINNKNEQNQFTRECDDLLENFGQVLFPLLGVNFRPRNSLPQTKLT